MRENFENQSGTDPVSRDLTPSLSRDDWARLEEVGDLHYHASAYSTALDYYGQLIETPTLSRMDRSQAFRILRKSVDSNILLGNLDRVEVLIERAYDHIAHTSSVAAPDEVAVNRAIFQTRQSTLLRERGRLHDALNLGKRAFSVLALTDEHTDVAILQVGMGICYLRLGRLEKAEEFFNDGLSTFRRIGHDLGVANLLNNLALLHKIRCRWDKALGLMEKAVEMAHGIGASHLLPGFYLNQGIILQKIDRLGESRSLLQKGLRLAVSLGDRMRQTRLNLAMGRLETLAGRLARAEELILEGKTLADQYRLLRESTIADEYLGDILLARGEHEKARFNYQLGLEKARQIAAGNDLEAELQRRMGEAHLAAGRLDEAVAVSQAAIAVCEQCGEDYELGFCHATLGMAYAAQNDPRQADHHFRQAIATFAEQRLTHHWCRTILAFTDHRIDDAGEPELLLLRRYLMDAQENGASSVSDRMLCRILERLAVVQIRLLQHDDALLTVFELERHAAGFEDPVLARKVVALRDRIESGLLGDVETTDSHLQAISCLPGLFAKGDDSIPRNLGAVLAAGMERVQADTGFIAMAGEEVSGNTLRIAARNGLTENLSEQLTHWFDGELASGRRTGTSFFSRLDQDDDLVAAVPAVATVASSCVLVPIALHGRQFGLLFLGKSAAADAAPGFDRAALDFLATYMGFLALFLYEKGRGGDPTPAGPFERVESFENIITRNVKMLEMLGLARKVAPSNLTVLLNGETGTGKGLLAYSIHALSKRMDKKFLSINCAAIPETLLESELFGHKRGSFTGAHSDKRGLLAEAEGGTVFLDEIGKMPFSMQGKLLQFLDTKVVRPVGSNQEITVDVRIICASKSDLHQRALEGTFLEDLYYRLLDFPLVIPPLRERPDDIELLARHFVERFSQELEVETSSMDSVFMDLLVKHPWPGNVRELEKVLRRAMVLAHGDQVLRPEHLPLEVSGSIAEDSGPQTILPLRETLAVIECREIKRALKLAGGNKSQVARDLKISYPNLLKKVRHYGLGQD
jgi:transcriptional regulator with GAF, ATPase, and Fis domain/tetratricopeptide (TPR) repeat protein